MLARRLLPVVPVLVAWVPSAFGQLPKRLEKCLPYPTLSQEIRDMQPAPTRVRVHVIRVDFDSNDGIPADAQEEISAQLRSYVFERDVDSAYLNDLANEIAEVGVRGALRDRGYFRATATAKLLDQALSPFGLMIMVDRAARLPETTKIRSALPASKSIQLQIAGVSSVRSLLRPHCFAELAAVGCGSPK